MNSPLGVDVPAPRLSWKLRSNAGGKIQGWWQILAATSADLVSRGSADLWDSGRINSERGMCHAYQGQSLESRQQVFWSVRIGDEQGIASSFAPVAGFETGLLKSTDFRAKWIGGGGILIRNFSLPSKPLAARAYISTLGCGELYLNEKKVGADVLDPAQTDYEKSVFYRTWDITEYLRAGENTVFIMLGDGFYSQSVVLGEYGWPTAPYGQPRAWLQIESTDAADNRTQLITDEQWQIAPSPILKNNIYAGEHYDARLESRHDVTTALPAAHVLEPPGGILRSQTIEPIRIVREIRPQAMHSPSKGVHIFDMGRNFAGWARINGSAPRGTELTLRFSEEVDGQGHLDTASTGVFATQVEQIDQYTFKGEGIENWRPRFTYHGFRYVEASGLPNVPSIDLLCGEQVRTDVRRVGHFESSDSRLNKLYEMALLTLESNLHGLLTDCPARERCGWLGDAQVAAEFSIYNFDMWRLWSKVVDDIFTSASAEGITMVAPGQRKCGPATPAWGSACVLLPWFLYTYYGDTRCMETHFHGMKQWVHHMESRSEAGIVSWGLGDWCPPGTVNPTSTPVPLTSTGYFYYCLVLMSRMAKVLNRAGDADAYHAKAQAVREAFNQRFFDEKRSTYGSQTGNVFALHLDLVPRGAAQAVAAELARDVRDVHLNHHTTGIIGTRYLFDQLARFGHGDVALAVLHQDTYPSFGHWISQGATTFWETWEKDPADEPTPRSRNHPMQAGFAAWFHQGLAGIRPDGFTLGPSHVLIEPQIIPGLDWVKASYDSPKGLIQSRWEQDGPCVALEVDVPSNVTAIVKLPTRNFEHSPATTKGSSPKAAVQDENHNGEFSTWNVTGGFARFVRH